MGEHFATSSSSSRREAVLAGPSLGPVFGIAVIEAADEEEARGSAVDPAVSSGLQTVELSPFRVSLLRGRD